MSEISRKAVAHGAGPDRKLLPLNSKRLTGGYVNAIARALELPTLGSVTEPRQMIDSKLGDDNREPLNIQVVIEEDHAGVEAVSLIDVDGVFLGPVPVVCAQEDLTDGGGLDKQGTVEENEATDENDVSRLQRDLAVSVARNEELEVEVSSLSSELERVKGRVNEMWKLNCAQVAGFDEAIVAKDAEIERLAARVAELEAKLAVVPNVGLAQPTHISPSTRHAPVPASSDDGHISLSTRVPVEPTPTRRGRAPPVAQFSGEDLECQLDDWLPSLERASVWNGWTAEEKLLQLAGYLKGRSLQEYNLLRPEEKESFEGAVEALRSRLDPGSTAVAAQYFRHAMQRDSESVADFI